MLLPFVVCITANNHASIRFKQEKTTAYFYYGETFFIDEHHDFFTKFCAVTPFRKPLRFHISTRGASTDTTYLVPQQSCS